MGQAGVGGHPHLEAWIRTGFEGTSAASAAPNIRLGSLHLTDRRSRSVAAVARKTRRVEPEDLSGNLIVQLGVATEDLNQRWYEANTGEVITDIQQQVFHPGLRWMAATLNGRVEGSGAVFEAKFMLPWSFSEEVAAEKYGAQLQHNMWVIAARSAVLSVITGGGKWVEIACPPIRSTST